MRGAPPHQLSTRRVKREGERGRDPVLASYRLPDFLFPVRVELAKFKSKHAPRCDALSFLLAADSTCLPNPAPVRAVCISLLRSKSGIPSHRPHHTTRRGRGPLFLSLYCVLSPLLYRRGRAWRPRLIRSCPSLHSIGNVHSGSDRHMGNHMLTFSPYCTVQYYSSRPPTRDPLPLPSHGKLRARNNYSDRCLVSRSAEGAATA